MPISIRITADLILSDFVGEVTGAELQQAAVDMLAIEEREPVTPGRIINLSAMTGLTLDFSAVNAFAQKRTASPLKNRTKSAIIAPEDIQYGFARMYEMLNQNPLLEVQVFRSRKEGEGWLLSK